MGITIKIPSPLRRFTESQRSVEVDANNVGDALRELVSKHGELGVHLCAGDNQLRSFINIYVGGEDIRYREGLKTELTDGDEIMIIPSVAGGSGGGESISNNGFSRDEYLRYSRHFTLPEIGLGGQRKLKEASVLIIGAGGLGSPISLYLAAAGVGRLGLVDFDRVELSNLQRQVIYTTDDIGESKLDATKKRLLAGNPNLEITTHEVPFTSTNALDIATDYDIIIDGTDNFPTRYLVNDVSAFLNKPNIYGSIFQFEGQLSIFNANSGPCYRCLYPEPPPPGLVPSCAEGGVLGVLPGIVGSLQATEAIKLITGVGDPMIGRLLIFDALAMTFTEVALRKNPDCPLCGKNPTITELIDYEGFCGVSSSAETVTVPEITVTEVNEILSNGNGAYLLDVREKWETEIAKIDRANLIPLGEIPDRAKELNPSSEIIVHCKSGVRSAKAVEYLIRQGFTNVKNMRGGILAWADQIDSSLNKY
ncbi:MAG: molybdopterin-synthase adenylyltransferase MoeB [candidate division Zixibacteria bacterium]|nr:molybdopterin-synthase adenylyltransferase MoeB [candidate division Zixibacteria bacterium]